MDEERRPLVIDDGEEITLYVRDRRRARQFILDNLIMDHWFPIIGETGYAIYSLLVRMSHSEDEKTSVGFSTICEHLGVDHQGRARTKSPAPQLSRATVTYYATLLEQCQLIYRDRPEIVEVNPNTGEEKAKRQGNKSNTYYILDVQEVTRSALETLKAAILADGSLPKKYKRIFTERIDRWRPIQEVWRGGNRRSIKTVVGQPSLFDDSPAGDPAAAAADPVIRPGTTGEYGGRL